MKVCIAVATLLLIIFSQISPFASASCYSCGSKENLVCKYKNDDDCGEEGTQKATKLPPFPSSILIHLGSNCVKLEMRFGRGCHNDTEVGLVDFCVDDKDHICFCTSDYCNFVNAGPSANILLIIITLFHVYQIK